MITPDKIIYSNRRTFSLEIDEWGKLTVRAPKKATKKEIEQVIVEKQRWILTKQQVAINNQPTEYEFDGTDEFFFLGKQYPMLFSTEIQGIVFDGERFFVHSKLSSSIQKAMTKWYKEKALKIATFLTDKYTDKLGIKHSRVKITSAKTRWGSCSSKKNININWRLVLAPLQVMEYVVAHEVAHLKYMDHSAKFWLTVQELQPSYKTYKKWLKDNHNLLNF
ncbi:MAG: SprT family zinc-dependent metalloprotease [Candidatus Kapaibacterium sp.]